MNAQAFRDSVIYSWDGWNQALFVLINGAQWPGRDALAAWGTFLGDHKWYPVVIALALTVSLVRPLWILPERVGVLVWSYLLSWWVIASLKPLLDLPRPLSVLGDGLVHVVGRPEYAHSFPSGHAAFVFLLWASVAPGAARPIRVGLGVFAFWVAWSRLAVGAHFPADVVGGALIGLVCAALVSGLWWGIRRFRAG